MDTICHHIVAVTAPREARLARIMARDGLDEAAALRRMAAQHDDAFYSRPGVTVLKNDGSPEQLRKLAATLLDELERRWGI